MENKRPRDLIVETLKSKSVLKQDIYDITLNSFQLVKTVFKEIASDLSQKVTKTDQRIKIEYKDKGEFEAELKVGGDLLIFNMHTNIFDFDKSHTIWKSSYLHEDPTRSYCGMITVHNFLSDSLKYNRVNDVGYLVARVFINKEGHFFVEGKKQLGFLYNDFIHSVIDLEKVTSITESIILYCLDFDLLTPPYDAVKQASVSEIQELSSAMHSKTGKRVGFKFHADDEL
jgi:hypothetical protein